MKFNEFYNVLQEYAPLEYSERFIAEGSYDNSGALVETTREIKTALFSLDLTSQSVKKAIEVSADVVVTHHPAIYRPIKSLPCSSPVSQAIAAGVGVISFHLNLDAAKGGIDSSFAEGLGGNVVKILDDFGDGAGYGRVCKTNAALSEFTENYKKIFRTDKVFAYGNKGAVINKYASFCGGGLGDEEVDLALKEGVDLVASADIPHHVLLRALENGLNVLSCAHYDTENYGMKKFSETVSDRLKNIKIIFFDDDRFV